MAGADVVIVGAGHGGAQCATVLRQNGFTGSIAMIGREGEPPYERPPLSKEYLSREKGFERLYIRPPSYWAENGIKLLLNTEVTAVHPATKQLTFRDGSSFGYETLVWATGGDPRTLSCPGSTLTGLHHVRTREDCDRLMGEIDGGVRQIVVIGGGYIGLEAAAVLTKLGIAITLLEALPRVLARVAGPELSSFYEAEHRIKGVDLLTGVAVAELVGVSRVTGVRLEDGRVLPAQAVIVGIGIVPCIGPLVAAGAANCNGVVVDEFCHTSLPDIYAIGDCAAFNCDYADGALMRVESVQNANDQATCVAKGICGEKCPFHALPWFWSNQYDVRLQTAGLSIGHDHTIVRGRLENRSFSIIYLKQGRVVALDCVNAVKDYIQGRKMVEARVSPDPAALADPEVPLKTLM